MKKLSRSIAFALSFAAIFFTINAKAQTTPANALRMGVGFELGDPTGDARIGTNFTIGGTIRLQYGITNDFALTLTGGAYHFHTKIIPGTDKRYDSYGELPFKAGVKEFFAPHIYVGGEVGAAFEITDSGWGPTRLLLSPALGYANNHWDFAVHYDNFSSTVDHFGIVGVRLAYAFKL